MIRGYTPAQWPAIPDMHRHDAAVASSSVADLTVAWGLLIWFSGLQREDTLLTIFGSA
jgi:hypothetical protein